MQLHEEKREVIMDSLVLFVEEILNTDLIRIILSNPKVKGEIVKVKIRPIEKKHDIYYQFESFTGTQVFHKNLKIEEAKDYLLQLMEGFKQMQVSTLTMEASVLISKKDKVTINRKFKRLEEQDTNRNAPMDRSHNRKKKYILEEGRAIPFLVDLGIMNREGKIIHAMYDKFRQINRYLEFVADVIPQLDHKRVIRIIDFGCGKSYLTFALYHYLHIMKGLQVEITGLDLKQDVIKKCNRLAIQYGYEHLTFQMGDIVEYLTRITKNHDDVPSPDITQEDHPNDSIQTIDPFAHNQIGFSKQSKFAHMEDNRIVDMVISLHACDTATDYAIASAYRMGAKVIFAVPCCQHEVNGQISSELLQPILKYGLLKERLSAIVTDALRAEYLESVGYDTQILEFIDMEHTPKNLLIRAILREQKLDSQGSSVQERKQKEESYRKETIEEIKNVNAFLHTNPKLEELIYKRNE